MRVECRQGHGRRNLSNMWLSIQHDSGHCHAVLVQSGSGELLFDENIGCVFSGLGLLSFVVLKTRARHFKELDFMCCKAVAIWINYLRVEACIPFTNSEYSCMC